MILMMIYTSTQFGNSFALTAHIAPTSIADQFNRLQFGAYLNEARTLGYALALRPGAGLTLELLRLDAGREVVVDVTDLPAAGSQLREIQWRRSTDGEMTVWVDGNEVMRVIDRGLRQPFRGVRIVNEGGAYTIRRIAVHAAPA